MLSEPGLKPTPTTQTAVSRGSSVSEQARSTTRAIASSFVSTPPSSTGVRSSRSRAEARSASRSFGRQLPPNPMPGWKCPIPMRGSAPTLASTKSASAPHASAIDASSLASETRTASAALAASFISSALVASVNMIGAGENR